MLKQIFSKISDSVSALFPTKPQPQPDIPFGRYSDAYKVPAQYDAWDKAMAHFEKEERMEAYRQFFNYLDDELEDSVNWREENGTLHFSIQQGSRMVIGTVNEQEVKAMSQIARADELNVGFMRRLMEFNFSLKYSRFALSPDNVIAIKFETQTPDGSPLKLYHALKELAVNADKQDDLLLDEFRSLQTIGENITVPLPESEKMVKYNFLRKEIEKAFQELDNGKPDYNQDPGGYVYLLLSLAYKLDFLIRPEGFMMDALEKTHRAYFMAAADKTPQLKILAMRKELQKLYDRPQADLFKEMYRTRHTFGITTPVGHDRVAALIESELPQMQFWMKDAKHHLIALAIPNYIAGFALFNYAMPKPDRDYLFLYFQIMEGAYFRDLGFQHPWYNKDGKPDPKAITRGIREVAEQNRKSFPKVAPNLNGLDFSGQAAFAKSFMEMLKELDVTKVD